MIAPKPPILACAILSFGFLLPPALASATPLDYVSVGDPIEDELRILELSGAPVRLPRLGMRPLQIVDLPALDAPLPGLAEISRRRLLRFVARDRGLEGIPGATPRLVEVTFPDDERFEVSAALEASGTTSLHHRPTLGAGSGGHARVGAQVGRWLAFADIAAVHVEGADVYAERILNNDVHLLTDQSSLSYTGARERWAVMLGRGRWQWGPGDEGSLLLSRTSPAFTALTFRLRIEPLRADGTILNATLGGSSGRQLAAHRIEWQPRDGLRLGVSEAACYKSSSWGPLYAVGVIPYTIVQNLLVRDEPDSGSALRNNVMTSIDGAWRIAPGTRVYSELLIDDLRTDHSNGLSKYGYLLGLEGAGTVRGSRVHWVTEFTRLTRFVYTSFFDCRFVVDGAPLGYPTGPDSRRLSVRAAWDPSVSWQVFGDASRTDRGESGLDVPFVPNSPLVNAARFAGVVETTRQLEAGLRWWPSSGVDVSVSGGSRWVDNVGHRNGDDRAEPFGTLSLRLRR